MALGSYWSPLKDGLAVLVRRTWSSCLPCSNSASSQEYIAPDLVVLCAVASRASLPLIRPPTFRLPMCARLVPFAATAPFARRLTVRTSATCVTAAL
eukprot:1308213-Pleurochrysis_carterae.AAC.1